MNSSSNTALEIAETPEIRPRPMRVPPLTMGPVSMLPDRRPPWKEFVFSMGSQSVLVLLLLWVGLLHPNVLKPPPRDYHFVRLVSTPHPVNHEPAPTRPLKAPPIVEVKTPDALKLPPTPVRVEHHDPLPVPKIEVTSKLPPQPAVTVIPKPIVKTNVFSTGSSQAPTIEKPAQQVQTGGFGDPRGVNTAENKNRPVTIARQGSFDLPTGGGYGNGSGGQHGARGVVASSGFGDGQAIADAKGSGPHRVISQGGFGDAQAADPSQIVSKRADVPPHIKPAEILSKPVPAYTEEARKLHVEGEVLLEVVFESSGSIRVVRVVRGLGHGLDESAIKAAQQIRFTPAQKDGQAVDSNGVLHILFQLA